jgi:hypothetical protein
LKAWWAAHRAAQHEARLAALNAQWDAKREVVKSYRAEAAIEMALAQAAHCMATQPYSLIDR